MKAGTANKIEEMVLNANFFKKTCVILKVILARIHLEESMQEGLIWNGLIDQWKPGFKLLMKMSVGHWSPGSQTITGMNW